MQLWTMQLHRGRLGQHYRPELKRSERAPKPSNCLATIRFRVRVLCRCVLCRACRGLGDAEGTNNYYQR
jgi:hypothetical protein